MEYKVYSLFDSQVKAYMQPFFMRTKGEAVRALMQLLGDSNTNVAKYPQDFILFQIGTYDDETGLIQPNAPESLGVAIEFKKEDVDSTVATPNGLLDPLAEDGIPRN